VAPVAQGEALGASTDAAFVWGVVHG
jgi:hypothetical protein